MSSKSNDNKSVERTVTIDDFDENGYLMPPPDEPNYEKNNTRISLENEEVVKNVMEELKGCQNRKKSDLRETASEYLEEESPERKINEIEEAGLITELNGNYYSTIQGVNIYNQLFDEDLKDTNSKPEGHLTG